MTWPSDWSVTTLGQAARWFSGGTPSTTEPAYWNGDIPWIGSGSLTSFYIKDSDRKVTSLGAANGTRLVSPGAVIFVVRGMSLKSEFRMGIAKRVVAFGQDCKALVARNGIDPTYLAYAIKAQTDDILGLVDEAGHGTGRLNTDQMRAVCIGFPSVAQQCAIADVLAALDDKIESNQKKAAMLELEARLVFRSLFDVEQRATGVLISKLVDVNPARPLRRGETATYVSMADLPVHSALIESWDSRSFTSGQRFMNGDVLMARITPCLENGKTAVVDMLESDVVGWGSTEFIVLSPRPPLTTPWVYCLARSEPVHSFSVRSMSGTSGRQRFPAAALDTYRIAQPSEEAVQLFNQVAVPSFQRMTLLRNENAKLRTLRDRLLPELLSGRIPVPVLNMNAKVASA